MSQCSFVCTQLNGFKYSYLTLIINIVWPINETLTITTNPGQSRLGSNNNEGVLHIPGLELHQQVV